MALTVSSNSDHFPDRAVHRAPLGTVRVVEERHVDLARLHGLRWQQMLRYPTLDGLAADHQDVRVPGDPGDGALNAKTLRRDKPFGCIAGSGI